MVQRQAFSQKDSLIPEKKGKNYLSNLSGGLLSYLPEHLGACGVVILRGGDYKLLPVHHLGPTPGTQVHTWDPLLIDPIPRDLPKPHPKRYTSFLGCLTCWQFEGL
jgi:hypothetical protein